MNTALGEDTSDGVVRLGASDWHSRTGVVADIKRARESPRPLHLLNAWYCE